MTNTWREDLEWYENHQTAAEIGFNPDGMCLKVCRTSREVGPKYLTAAECRDATPEEFRHKRVRDLRKGMKLYFGDPNDSNTADHIVTMVGRVKGFDWDELNDVLVETNSVKAGELVVVRATYFYKHWGDPFQFGANWINGVELDYAGSKRKERVDPGPRIEKFRDSGNEWNVNYLDKALEKGGNTSVAPKIKRIEELVAQLPDDPEDDSLVSQFKQAFRKDRILKMRLLNEAVDNGRTGPVKEVRDGLRAAIKSVLVR